MVGKQPQGPDSLRLLSNLIIWIYAVKVSLTVEGGGKKCLERLSNFVQQTFLQGLGVPGYHDIMFSVILLESKLEVHRL